MMLKKLKSVNWGNGLWTGLVILPACLLGILILRYGVNVPYWDQWSTPAELFEQIATGKFSIAEFYQQHNEHRLVFPQLIFLGLAYLTQWDTRYEMIFTFLLACLTAINLYRLNRQTVQGGRATTITLALVSNLLIFSPVQFENWLWGFQSALFMPMFYITVTLLIARSHRSISTKFWLCAAIAFVSSFSMSNGLFCWLAFPPVLVLSEEWPRLRSKWLLVGGWLIGFIGSLLLYFYDYHKPAHHPSLTEALFHPFRTLTYFFAFLGSPLSAFKLGAAIVIGFILTSLFLALLAYLLRRRDRALGYQAISWIVISGFVFASAGVTALGRSGFGVEQAMASRYTTFAVYLSIAVLHLLAIVAADYQHRRLAALEGVPSPTSGISPQTVRSLTLSSFTALATALAVLSLLSATNGLESMQSMWRDRLYAKACLTYVNFVDKSCIEQTLFPNTELVQERATTVEALGFINPDVADSAEVESAPMVADRTQYGYFDRLQHPNADDYTATGWATSPEHHRPADAVLLTYRLPNSSQPPKVFTVAPVRLNRQDVADHLKDNAFLASGWTVNFSAQDLPNRRLRIDAWAFDAGTGQAVRLKEFHRTKQLDEEQTE